MSPMVLAMTYGTLGDIYLKSGSMTRPSKRF